MDQFKNRTVIITGAGSGMGKSMAILFAANGANVVASDLKQDRLEALEKEMQSKGNSITTVTADVSNEMEVNKIIAIAVKTYGSIDVLINNAGIMDDFMPVADASTELWNKVMGVNINGPFFACRAAVPYMIKKGKGVIINVSSIGGLNGSRAGVAYTSSKHALIGLSKNIGFMYSKKGIRCNVIAPGGVNTSIGENMHPNTFGYENLALGMNANPRMGQPEEVAEVALFLASDQSSFVNGSVVTVDGGWTAY